MGGSEAGGTARLVGVVLAAGLGTRLRPLTLIRPKCLCPVGNVPLLDLAIASVRPHVDSVAANAHYLAAQVTAHLAGTGVLVSHEAAAPLGSAGALGHLREWIDGRPVLVRNADAYLEDDLSALVDGWDGRNPRLLVRDTGNPSDFGTHHYLGASLIPADSAAALPDERCGLYERVWRPAWEAGRLELVPARGAAVDCGTAADYLAANLLASGGASVIGAGASVEGTVERCVIWPGARVGPEEHLVEVVRAADDVTVDARRHPD
jgi:N-acetyl-alpha-D-muramate 1-phosphate uridylyltransferase